MKRFKITKQDQFGHERTFVIRRDEIIALNTVRKRPCISEGGECHIVSCYTIFDDGEHIEITDKVDVDVFATVPEAYRWAALMSGKVDDSRSVQKHTYNVRFHNIG